MKNCFISLPITGMVEQSKDKSKVLKECLMSIYPQCNFYIPCEVAPAYDMPDSYYMGLCVSKLMDCDTVIACGGWEESKGCQCEKFIAETYGIEWSTLKDFCLETMKDNDIDVADFDNHVSYDLDSVDTSYDGFCFVCMKQASQDWDDFETVHINIDEGCSVEYSTIWKEVQKYLKFDKHIKVLIHCDGRMLDEDVLAIMLCALKCSNKNLIVNMEYGICYHSGQS